MAKNLSAIAKNLDTLSEKEARWSGWDPQLSVPVTEILGYNEDGGTANLVRVSVGTNGYLMVSGSAGGGSVTLDGSATNNRVSTFSQDAGLMRVSAVGGSTVSLSADASGNRVSAVQESAANLLVSAKSDSAGQLRVSAIVDTGSISAKSGDANQLHVSSVQGDAALLRVSAIGGTAGDNVLVDGSDQSVSAKLIQVSASVSSNMNTLLTRMTSYDAANAHVSSYQGGSWTLSAFINEGTISARSTDAGSLLVSGKTDSAAQFRVSAFVDSGSVSAKSGDGAQLHVSATNPSASLFLISAYNTATATNFLVSAVQNDAGLLHVSAIGGTAGDNVLVDGTTQSLSATVQRVSGVVSSGANALAVYAQNRDDAVNLRISALSKDGGTFLVSASGGQLSATLKEGTAFVGNVSAKNTDAANFAVSAVQGDSNLLRVSAKIWDGTTQLPVVIRTNTFADTLGGLLAYGVTSGTGAATVPRQLLVTDEGKPIVTVSAKDANEFHVSSVQGDAGLLLVSGKSDSAGQLRVSAFSDSAALLRVSAFSNDAALNLVSGKTDSAAQFRVSAFVDSGSVSAKSGDANQLHTSAVQGDAALLRVSADLIANTVGALTVFQTLSVSASQNVKSTAGAIYGYYAYNSDTKMNFIKFYNVSAAVNVGTDTPILTIGIPASAAANVEFPHGLVGFTNGIGIAATSGRPVDNSAAPAASSVGLDLFYK